MTDANQLHVDMFIELQQSLLVKLFMLRQLLLPSWERFTFVANVTVVKKFRGSRQQLLEHQQFN